MNKPLIGVLPLWDRKKESIWMMPGYLDGVIQAGGLPMVLPLTQEEQLIRQIAKACDGFLFTGGQDVLPERYGQQRNPLSGNPCAARDNMEELLFAIAVQQLDKPYFGICRGLQYLNVLLGGTLVQDLPTMRSSSINHRQNPPYSNPSHALHVIPGTPLHQLVQDDEIQVNSYHHQAIDVLSPQLQSMATSPDGLVEAVFLPGRRYVRAVQWHPEYALSDSISKLLFADFIAACKV